MAVPSCVRVTPDGPSAAAAISDALAGPSDGVTRKRRRGDDTSVVGVGVCRHEGLTVAGPPDASTAEASTPEASTPEASAPEASAPDAQVAPGDGDEG